MYLRRLNVKIAILYSVAFLLSSLVLLGLTAYLLFDSLRGKDRDLLTEKLHEYASLYERDGVKGLQLKVSGRKIKNAQDFVVRLADPEGKTVLIHSPDRSDDTDAPQLADIDRFLSALHGHEEWTVIPGGGFGDDVEVVSQTLPGGEVLYVGKDTEDREEFFQSFLSVYLRVLVPICLLALVVGAYLSNRLLKPIRWLTQTVESIRLGNTKARVATSTARDELYLLTKLFNDMLDQTTKLIDGMRDTLDNVAHDLRTPIMRLQNAVEKALSDRPDVERLREALMDSKENSDLILELVNGIMVVREAEAGTLILRRERVNSRFLVDAVLDLYGFVSEDKGIQLVAGASEDFILTGDRTRLLQALSNLVDNAIKYSPSGTRVEISCIVNGGYGEIRVTDQGVGVPEGELEKIWERLYRVDASRGQRGLGLGLSLVRAITLSHGGTVATIQNPSRIGITFVIRLPGITKV